MGNTSSSQKRSYRYVHFKNQAQHCEYEKDYFRACYREIQRTPVTHNIVSVASNSRECWGYEGGDDVASAHRAYAGRPAKFKRDKLKEIKERYKENMMTMNPCDPKYRRPRRGYKGRMQIPARKEPYWSELTPQEQASIKKRVAQARKKALKAGVKSPRFVFSTGFSYSSQEQQFHNDDKEVLKLVSKPSGHWMDREYKHAMK